MENPQNSERNKDRRVVTLLQRKGKEVGSLDEPDPHSIVAELFMLNRVPLISLSATQKADKFSKTSDETSDGTCPVEAKINAED